MNVLLTANWPSREYHGIDGSAEPGYGIAMTIELKPEQARILQEALRQGRFQSVEQALDQAIHSIETSGSAKHTLSTAERAAAFRSWAASHPRNKPVLSDEAISRERIYSDRG